MPVPISRRRFISIAACAGAAAIGPAFGATEGASYQAPTIWRGMALGAQAQIQLYHENDAFAVARLEDCRREIARLENLFSLYRENSAISQLNRDGELAEPAIDMVELLSKAKSFSVLTDGAFDVTIQPLWQLYAHHFSADNADQNGPSDAQIYENLQLVGSDGISISSREIKFARNGMALTLNGIAQGYVTEKITALLRRAGFENVLVHLGESQALGHHPDGRPWSVGIPVPSDNEDLLASVSLENQALATSGGYGTPLSDNGQHHHLLDPRTGRSANHHRSVSVVAPGATNADMLSTALSIMPIDEAADLLAKFDATRAIILTKENRIVRI